jgi:chromosome segregation ATPase
LNSQPRPHDQTDLDQQLAEANQTINSLKENLKAKEDGLESLLKKLYSLERELIDTQDELEHHYQRSQDKSLLIDRYRHQQNRAKALITSLLHQINPPSRSQIQEPPQGYQTSP